MKKFLLIICLLPVLLSSCAIDTFNMYEDTIKEDLRDPKTRKIQGNENDVNDLRGCPILFKQKWTYSKRWSSWGPDQNWFDGRMVTATGVTLDYKDNLSPKILPNKSLHPVYIGPWHHSPKLQKQIRFFAYQKTEGGSITYQYESLTPENKSIKEKPFSLSPNSKYAPDKFSLCAVKWTAKYGYNAVADLHKNPWFPIFSNKYLVGTGKIIDAKE